MFGFLRKLVPTQFGQESQASASLESELITDKINMGIPLTPDEIAQLTPEQKALLASKNASPVYPAAEGLGTTADGRKVINPGTTRAQTQAQQKPIPKVINPGLTRLQNQPKSGTTVMKPGIPAPAVKGKFNPASLIFTAAGGAIGFLLAGPIGAGAGLALGGGTDFFRAHHVKKATPTAKAASK